MKNNNSTLYRNNNNGNSSAPQNHNNHQGNQHDRRKQQMQNQPQQQQHQSHQQQHHFQGQRDRSGQRNQSAQHPDSSMGRENVVNQSSLGSIRFSPGFSTRELPPIETKTDPHKKFTGRCRLFIGNLPHNTTEERLKSLFETYGEVGEVFLGPKSAFAFIKMDSRRNAEAARDALDCTLYENRTLRVRLAAHAAAIRVKHLSPQVTNELLAYAFRYFGEIERAIVVVDDKGKSIGEGIVEYSKKQSALYAIKRCQQECFMLTASPKPVLVEPFDQHDEDEGLPEKSINKNSAEFNEQRSIGPRFAEQGTFEHTYALRWQELYAIEKQKRERLEEEIQEARKDLLNQIQTARLDHDEMQLRNKLQQLEDDKMKLQQMKEQTINDAQRREEQRRQQDMLMRQREEEILRRQQLSDPNCMNQQESALRMQADVLQDLISQREQAAASEDSTDPTQQKSQQPTGSQAGPEIDAGISMNQMNMSTAPQMTNQPRTFADLAMIGLNPPPIYHIQQPMGMAQPNPQLGQPSMFTTFIPQQHQMNMQMPPDGPGNPNFGGPPPGFGVSPQQHHQQQKHHQQQQHQQQQQAPGAFGRQQKFSKQYNNPGNNGNVSQSNNGGRPRKRGRY